MKTSRLHQEKARQDPQRSGRECRMRHNQKVHLAEQLGQPDHQADERGAVDGASRRRQLHREREEEHARVGDRRVGATAACISSAWSIVREKNRYASGVSRVNSRSSSTVVSPSV